MSDTLLARGVSDAAQYIEQAITSDRRVSHESSAFSIKSMKSDELASVWEECRAPNWDGYQALPVSRATLRKTYEFLEVLPQSFPLPSIGADPYGSLTLEWHRHLHRSLTISVTSEGDLHYAALLGPSESYGTEVFFGDIPDAISRLIKKVYQ